MAGALLVGQWGNDARRGCDPSERLSGAIFSCLMVGLLLAGLSAQGRGGVARAAPPGRLVVMDILPDTPAAPTRVKRPAPSRATAMPRSVASQPAAVEDKGERLDPPASPVPATVLQARRPALILASFSPAPPPVPATTGLESASEVDAYVRRIWSMIAAHRPAGVHLEGAIGIAFCLDRGGTILSVKVVDSSGDPMLDKLALKTVERTAPFPPPPVAAGAAPAFTIQFHFR